MEKSDELVHSGMELAVQERWEEALEKGVEALKIKLEKFGKGSVHVVPAYLLMGDVHLSLGKLKSTEEFVSMANWNIVKAKIPNHQLMAKLHILYGKLCIAKKNLVPAREHLANAAYFFSLEYGPEHIETSVAYFELGNSFRDEESTKEQCLASFDKVVDIWYKFVSLARTVPQSELQSIQLFRALQMFLHILDIRTRELGADHIATGETKYTLVISPVIFLLSNLVLIISVIIGSFIFIFGKYSRISTSYSSCIGHLSRAIGTLSSSLSDSDPNTTF